MHPPRARATLCGVDQAPAPADRRPIRARETGWARSVSQALARAGVSPNAISMASIGAAVLAGGAFVSTRFVESHPASAALFILAAAAVQLRLLANLFDGMVAMQQPGPRDPLGALWNDLPDRLSDTLILASAGFALGGSPVAGWVASILALCTAYVRAYGPACGTRPCFLGPMAKQQRMAVITAACVVAAIVSHPLAPDAIAGSSAQVFLRAPLSIALWLISAGCVLTIARRIRRVAADLRDQKESP